MTMRVFKIALFTALALPGSALADEAHERDHAMVRQLNQRELDHVRRRDTAEAARGTTNTAELADYARRRAQYERDLAAWRRATGQR